MVTQSKVKRCQVCGLDYELSFIGERCPEDDGLLKLADPDPLIAIVIADRYTVESRIGSGGFSTVYLAFDNKLKRQVAIKLLHAFLQNSPDLIRRFTRETELTARLLHPNLAVIYDSGALSNGQPYIAMEHLRGTTLEDVVIAEKRLSVKRTVNIIAQTCDALGYAHKAGVIHRDLTPRNIFLLDDDVVKLIDFGLAFSLDGSHSLTSPGEILGTPQFMSPEQCRGQSIDCRADIYSVGLIMQFMLSGIKPIDGENLFEVIGKQIHDPPVPLSEVCPDLYFPAAIRQAIQICLAKDPNDRFSTCEELKEAIESFQHIGSATKNRLPVQAAKAKSNSTKHTDNRAIAIGLTGGLVVTAALGLVFYTDSLFRNHQTVVPHMVPAKSDATAVPAVSHSNLSISAPKVVALPAPGSSAKIAAVSPAVTHQSATISLSLHPQPTKREVSATAKPVQAAPNEQPKKIAISNGDAQKTQSQTHERTNQAKLSADKAFNSNNYDVALMFYRELDRELHASGYRDIGATVLCKVRILQCLRMLRRNSEIEPNLNETLSLILPNLKPTIKVVNNLPNACLIWNLLASESYEAASNKGLNATRADYLNWAEDFFKLAHKQWNKPKDDSYRRMIGKYCSILRSLGKFDQANNLEQTEHPIFDRAAAAPPADRQNTSSGTPTAAAQPQSPSARAPNRGRGHNNRYVRNYHFK